MSDDEVDLVECPNCQAEYEEDSYCGECGYGQEVGELVEAEGAPHARRGADASEGASSAGPEAVKPEPVYVREIDARPFPVHEAAWCPYCVAWLGTFPSTDEARAYEASLENHPFEFCNRRKAKLNGSEEWRLRHEAAKFGSLARSPPTKPRVPGEAREEVST